MTVQDLSTDVIGTLRPSAQSGLYGISPADYPYRSAGSDCSGQDHERRAGCGTAPGPRSAQERRKTRRHEEQLALTMSVFNQSAFFMAQMVNYSQDGVCVETSQHILPGTSLHVRIDASQPAAAEHPVFPGFRMTALGEVKWCRALDQGCAPRYLVGIRYYSYY